TQKLIRRWLSDGYDVSVVMPRPIMQHILRKLLFVPSSEYFPDQYEDPVEVWNCKGTSSQYGLLHREAVEAG
ncbi:MAG: hypothetical protein Q7T80_13860, partial [Methanoregula sp.]|nr:hypothetical protein [Methanoregula sp.]